MTSLTRYPSAGSMHSLSGFRFFDTLNVGQESFVTRALRESDNARVILKILRNPNPSHESVARLRREAEIVTLLQREELFGRYEYIQQDNVHALVIDEFSGDSLLAYLKKRTFSLLEVIRIMKQVTSLLDVLHSHHIVHQNICPQNILWDPITSNVRLIDYGLASRMVQHSHLDLWEEFWVADELHYIAPEQINRGSHNIDSRADFYSIGATFYHITTGTTPFQFNEVHDLLHSHLSEAPPPPYEHDRNIPPKLSELILKLLCKEPEQRYQSARGLCHDLETCYQMLLQQGYIARFKLGENDHLPLLRVTNQLVGRESETELLTQSFQNIMTGKGGWVFLSGSAGMGKTAMAQHLHQKVVEKHGFFVRGRSDQLKVNSPYWPLLQASKHLIRQLLLEPPHLLRAWRSRINDEIYPNGQVLLDIIPEWESILGDQPEIPAIKGEDSQKRLKLVVSNFLRALGTKEHPVVFFLDNMEWTDLSTLNMFKSVYESGMMEYCLVVVSFRDNEIHPEHPMLKLMEEWDLGKVPYIHCPLTPLTQRSIQQLLRLSLKGPGDHEFSELADVCYRKTAGNPFFLREFLNHIYQQSLLRFHMDNGTWVWELEPIRNTQISDNVLAYHLDTIHTLPESQQHVLRFCSCLGSQFDPRILRHCLEEEWDHIRDHISGLCEAGLFVLGSGLSLEELDWVSEPSLYELFDHPPMRFVHSQMQQAVYDSLGSEERSLFHFQLGSTLQKLPGNDLKRKHIFTIAQHLNEGASHLTSSEDMEALARLNLEAGRVAKSQGAFVTALNFFRNALLVYAEHWEDAYELTFSLHLEVMEAAYLSKEYEVAKRYSTIALEQSKSVMERAVIQEIEVLSLLGQHEVSLALEKGLSTLATLGVSFPSSPKSHDIVLAFLKLKNLRLVFAKRSQFYTLPVMKSEKHLASMRLLASLISAAFTASPNLLPLLVLKMVELTQDHGRAPMSGFAFSVLGMIVSYQGFPQKGSLFGEIALHLHSMSESDRDEGTDDSLHGHHTRILFVEAAFLKPWKDSIHSCLRLLKDGYEAGISAGDFEYASYNLSVFALFSYLTLESLPEVEEEVGWAVERIERLKQPLSLIPTNHYLTLVRILRGQMGDEKLLHQDVLRPLQELATDMTEQHMNNVFTLNLHQMLLFTLLEEWDNIDLCCAKAERFLMSAQGSPEYALFYFYRALAYGLRPYKSNIYQKRAMGYLKQAIKRLKTWSVHAPENYKAKYELSIALLAWLKGNDDRARLFFGKAIESADSTYSLLDLGIAKKAFGLYFVSVDQRPMAAYFFEKSFGVFERWGARRICDQLADTYQQFVQPGKSLTSGKSMLQLGYETVQSQLSYVDFASIQKLLDTMIHDVGRSEFSKTTLISVAKHLKSERGVLFVRDRKGWFVEGECTEKLDGLQYRALHQPLDQMLNDQQHQMFCNRLVRQVMHRQSSVLVQNAQEHSDWMMDGYVQKYSIQSILSIPLMLKGEISGCLYFETKASPKLDRRKQPKGFLPSHLEALELISKQVAVFLDSSRSSLALKSDLEEQNSRFRMQYEALHETQTKLAHTAKMSSLGVLAGGVAHEIRNPLNYSVTAAHQVETKFVKLQKEILSLSDDDNEILEYWNSRFKPIEDNLANSIGGLDKIKQIVEDFLRFSQLNEVESKQTPIGENIRYTLDMVKANFELPVQIDVNIEDDPIIHCYPAELNQAILNVVVNAFEAVGLKAKREKPGWKAKLKVITKCTNPNHLVIYFMDTGVGISKENLPHVSEPFFTTKKEEKHSGLGLATAHGIIHRHHGKIEFFSEEGMGTEVRITLPFNLDGKLGKTMSHLSTY